MHPNSETVFTIEFLVSRSSKVDHVLIGFEKKNHEKTGRKKPSQEHGFLHFFPFFEQAQQCLSRSKSVSPWDKFCASHEKNVFFPFSMPRLNANLCFHEKQIYASCGSKRKKLCFSSFLGGIAEANLRLHEKEICASHASKKNMFFFLFWGTRQCLSR